MGTYYNLELDFVPKNHNTTSVFNPAVDRHLIFMGASRTNGELAVGVLDNFSKVSRSRDGRLVGF
jgi:hypothetical protein